MKIDTSLQKITPEYREVKFKDEQSFKDWLKRKAKYVVKFVDNGQDCLEWVLDECGEVLNANLQAFVWNGKIVDLGRLKIGSGVVCIDIEKYSGLLKHKRTEYDFVVSAIIKLKKRK